MSITIYGIAASRASRPLWMAEELALDYAHVPTPYQSGATHTPEFLALNPNGHIPVVVDDGLVVWESMACSLHLALRYGPGLSVQERAEALRWSFWAVTEVEKDALTVLMHRRVMLEARRRPELAAEAEKRLAAPLSVLNTHLAEREWMAGECFTVADVNVASVVAWAQPAQELLSSLPALTRWLGNALERPAQQKVRVMARAAVL
jgi:glutathione S-transferase